MRERDFYRERRETKKARFTCPYCRELGEYQVRWLVREKKGRLPHRANPADRRRFSKIRSYMVREDEYLFCPNPRCRRRFEIPSQQSVVLL